MMAYYYDKNFSQGMNVQDFIDIVYDDKTVSKIEIPFLYNNVCNIFQFLVKNKYIFLNQTSNRITFDIDRKIKKYCKSNKNYNDIWSLFGQYFLENAQSKIDCIICLTEYYANWNDDPLKYKNAINIINLFILDGKL